MKSKDYNQYRITKISNMEKSQQSILYPSESNPPPKQEQPQQKQWSNNSKDEELSDKQSSSQNQTQSNSAQSENQMIVNKQYQMLGINKNITNQGILMKISPESTIWYKGSILFSSEPPKEKEQIEDGISNLLEMLDLRDSHPKQLINVGTSSNYFVISKCEPRNGKILMLDESVYKQKFYINYRHLLALNYHNLEYNLKTHNTFKQLKIIQAKAPPPLPLVLILQSSKDTAIIEKYLAAQENLYLPNAKILAISQTIKYKWESKLQLYKFTGPGWMFFQPCSRNMLLPIKNRDVIIANLTLIAIIIALYIIEDMFLL